jgi:hypothetical protein
VHVGTEIVVEFFRDGVAWNGLVEIFDLKGHPKAKRCYAWSYPVTDDTQCVTVLKTRPVDSAESAVRVPLPVAKSAEKRLARLDRFLMDSCGTNDRC